MTASMKCQCSVTSKTMVVMDFTFKAEVKLKGLTSPVRSPPLTKTKYVNRKNDDSNDPDLCGAYVCIRVSFNAVGS